ncbi:unnamed protein product [Urochloa humidicola]
MIAPEPPPPPPPQQQQQQPTAYEMLERYNFTEGILPEGVMGYVLRPDGSFEVYLPGDCAFRAGSMQVRYGSRVAGTIRSLPHARVGRPAVALRRAKSSRVRDGRWWPCAAGRPGMEARASGQVRVREVGASSRDGCR